MLMKNMHPLLLALSLLGSLAALGSGCGDDDDGGGASKSVCEEAGEILVSDCGFEAGGDGGGGGAACEGESEASSRCVVDFPTETCEALENITDPAFSNAYTECVMGG